MPPGTGLVLGLGTNGVATGGGTYPDDTCKVKPRGRDALRGGCHSFLVSRPQPSVFPAVLTLTRALKGSFLVMSSSSEDRESISRSILLTFSLGWRVRGQGSEHPSQSSRVIPVPWCVERIQDSSLVHGGNPHPTSYKAALQGLPPYLWWELGGGLRPSLLLQGGWRGGEDVLLQRSRGEWLLDHRGRWRWEGTSQGTLRVVPLPNKGRRGQRKIWVGSREKAVSTGPLSSSPQRTVLTL